MEAVNGEPDARWARRRHRRHHHERKRLAAIRMRYLPNGRAVKVRQPPGGETPATEQGESVDVRYGPAVRMLWLHWTSQDQVSPSRPASGNPLQVHPVRWLSPVNGPDLDVAVGWPPALMRTVQWEPDQSSPIRAVTDRRVPADAW